MAILESPITKEVAARISLKGRFHIINSIKNEQTRYECVYRAKTGNTTAVEIRSLYRKTGRTRAKT
jgi:hypothetical protein